MVELHGQRVLEQVKIPGRGFAEARGHKRTVDERPGIETHAGIEPRHQRAGQQLQEDQRENEAGDPGRPSRRRLGAPRLRLAAETEHEPERIAEDEQRHAEMRGEPVLADVGAIDEAALHHVPADRAL